MPKNGIPLAPAQSPKRKSTGKRLRFEIFKRDGFVCQYCGAQPPDVVLVVDHITPVATGGTNDPMNLITACESCNQGKAAKPLGDRIVRPDADLLYLETQQEIAELRRYQDTMRERDQLVGELISTLQETWFSYSDLDWAPAEKLLRQFIDRYGHEATDTAVRDVATKVGSNYLPSYGNKWIAYMHAVARNTAGADEGDD